MKSYHYVDDARYAKQYVECMKEKKSRRQIEQELHLRGVERSLVETAFEETEDVPEEVLIRGWMEKRHYQPESADEGEKRRRYAFLARKGFSGAAIVRAMKGDSE